MKKLPYLLLLLGFGCTHTETNYIARVKPQTLTEAELYNEKLAFDARFDAQELQIDSLKKASQQLFLKAMDTYVNKKDPAHAVDLLKQSILVLPDATSYYQLGNALSDAGNHRHDYAAAIKAYRVAEFLGFEPMAMLHYNMALACNHVRDTDNFYEAISYLQEAFSEGFTDTNALYHDPNMAALLQSREYKDMFKALDMQQISRRNGGFFASFADAFVEYNQPFAINVKDVGNVDNKRAISFEFAEFIPEMQNTTFGREVSNDFFYVAKVAQTPAYTALIYSSVSFFGEGPLQPVTTKLVTFSPEGKIIASKLFAAQFSAEKIKTGEISNNEITLRDYTRTWKKPIDEVAFEENEVDKCDLVSTSTFKLMDNGDIVEVSSVPAQSKTNL